MFLDAVIRKAPGGEGYPWTVPLIANLQELRFTNAVTFFVGENGCGKSTLLEGLAWASDAVAAGSHDMASDPSLAAAREFGEGFKLSRTSRARTRLFLRAEDVFGYVKRVAADMAGLQADAQELSRRVKPGYGQDLAMAVARGQERQLADTYGADPDGRSHGETFLSLLQARLRPHGLYFLDEPETPLSPTRVLALMILLRDAVAEGSQFVIATHSPILLALPGAAILQADGGVLAPVAWGELEHVRVTRAFLNDPESVLRRLGG